MQKGVGEGEKKKKHSSVSNCRRKREKNCAIFICPYRETVATIPAIDLIQADKLKLISIPQITKSYNLAQLRL